ncbi:MAG TPA: hypothetical protein VGL89_03180 [Candidatus Koribacter sp.]
MRLLLLSFVLIYSVCVFGYNADQQSKPEQPQTQTEKEPKPQNPSVLDASIDRPLAQPEHEAHTSEREQKPELWGMNVSEWVMSFLTLAYVLIASGTLYVIREQGKDVHGTVAAMRDQHAVMLLQYESTKSQVDLIEKQVSEMSEQTKILQESVGASAAAAETSKRSVDAMIDKERARISIELGTLKIDPPSTQWSFNHVEYRVFVHGATPAFIEDATYRLDATGTEEFPENDTWPHSMNLKRTMVPNFDGELRKAIFFRNEPIESEILARKQFVHFAGGVFYKDVFGIKRETRFRYIWDVTDLSNLDGKLFAYWRKLGGDSENFER